MPLLRPRGAEDLDACVAALAQTHHADGYPMNWPADPAAWLCSGESLGAWVAELDGRVAGHLRLSRSTPDDQAPGLWSARTGAPRENCAVVSRLFVAPAARGHGLGALLLEHGAARARDRGLHPVLDVVAKHRAPNALYERLGWEPLGTREAWWGPSGKVTLRCWAAPEP